MEFIEIFRSIGFIVFISYGKTLEIISSSTFCLDLLPQSFLSLEDSNCMSVRLLDFALEVTDTLFIYSCLFFSLCFNLGSVYYIFKFTGLFFGSF